MEDRIGQRLLRFLGLDLAEVVERDRHRAEGAFEEVRGDVAEAPPKPASDDAIVERFEANPFLDDAWTAGGLPDLPPEEAPLAEPDASELAPETPLVEHADEVTEKTAAHADAPDDAEPSDADDRADAERPRDAETSEDDRPGAGWVRGQAATSEAKATKGLRHALALGDEHRCHGLQADGTRCLRRAVEGKAYCREHTAGSSPRDV